MTSRKLDNLISQTEYGLAVTPIYDEGPSQPMLGAATTGKNEDHYHYNDTWKNSTHPIYLILTEIEITQIKDIVLVVLTSFPLFCRCGPCSEEPAILRGYPDQL